jgi:hypothetical protein
MRGASITLEQGRALAQALLQVRALTNKAGWRPGMHAWHAAVRTQLLARNMAAQWIQDLYAAPLCVQASQQGRAQALLGSPVLEQPHSQLHMGRLREVPTKAAALLPERRSRLPFKKATAEG